MRNVFGRKLMRFRLSTVIVGFAVVGAFFGFAKWQYSRTQHEYQRLSASGIEFITSTPARAGLLEFVATGKTEIWKFTEATLFVERIGKSFSIMGRHNELTLYELNSQIASFKRRLDELGCRDFSIAINGDEPDVERVAYKLGIRRSPIVFGCD